MKSDDHSINNELIIKLLWCELAYLHFQFATTFKFTQCLCNCRNCWTFAKDYATPHCDLTSWSKYVQQFRQLHKHCVNLNVVANWKCKYASSHHNNLMINSLLILWSSDFIWFSKSYDQQFGGLKIKINALL